ncbi:MAG: ABC transporter ATP-binding protein [Nitriliruptoraceae bacterium]
MDHAAAEPMIRIDHVNRTYPGQGLPAVADLSLDIHAGELVVFVGPSGCGKTTTLKMINRIIEPTSGRILVDGRDAHEVPAHELRRQIGYVIQRVGLFPHRTVRQNISTVPELLGWPSSRISDRVDELLVLMDLDPGLLDRYPAALSGGQQQRVGVARALAADPPILLMDEPYGAVDPVVRAHLQAELLALQLRAPRTIVFVTHDIDEALALGDRIAILGDAGSLQQYDTPEHVLRAPANDVVSAFLGRERNLRRLALMQVGDAALVEGPVVDVADDLAVVRAVADQEQVDWLGVRDRGRLLGWIWRADIPASGRAGDAPLHDFRVTVGPTQSLRAAVDAIVTTRNQVAVVVDDDGRHLGMLFIENVGRELWSS